MQRAYGARLGVDPNRYPVLPVAQKLVSRAVVQFYDERGQPFGSQKTLDNVDDVMQTVGVAARAGWTDLTDAFRANNELVALQRLNDPLAALQAELQEVERSLEIAIQHKEALKRQRDEQIAANEETNKQICLRLLSVAPELQCAVTHLLVDSSASAGPLMPTPQPPPVVSGQRDAAAQAEQQRLALPQHEFASQELSLALRAQQQLAQQQRLALPPQELASQELAPQELALAPQPELPVQQAPPPQLAGEAALPLLQPRPPLVQQAQHQLQLHNLLGALLPPLQAPPPPAATPPLDDNVGGGGDFASGSGSGSGLGGAGGDAAHGFGNVGIWKYERDANDPDLWTLCNQDVVISLSATKLRDTALGLYTDRVAVQPVTGQYMSMPRIFKDLVAPTPVTSIPTFFLELVWKKLDATRATMSSAAWCKTYLENMAAAAAAAPSGDGRVDEDCA